MVDRKKMAKSKGNAIFLHELLDKGYEPQHIRYYLIYGNYREKKNFKFQELRKFSKQLDRLRELTGNFCEPKKVAMKSRDKIRGLVHRITSAFEESMNDDLNVGKVFDKLHKILNELNRLRELGRLSEEECRLIIEQLKTIDEVLKVIFD